MAPPDIESQFAFLISCIKYTNAGKVDFAKVAKELEIVSKGAAAKRYERLMKTHGIKSITSAGRANVSPLRAASAGPVSPTRAKLTPSGRKLLPTHRPAPAGKKRKMAARVDDVDDEENVGFEIESETKSETKSEIKQEAPKA